MMDPKCHLVMPLFSTLIQADNDDFMVPFFFFIQLLSLLFSTDVDPTTVQRQNAWTSMTALDNKKLMLLGGYKESDDQRDVKICPNLNSPKKVRLGKKFWGPNKMKPLREPIRTPFSSPEKSWQLPEKIKKKCNLSCVSCVGAHCMHLKPTFID